MGTVLKLFVKWRKADGHNPKEFDWLQTTPGSNERNTRVEEGDVLGVDDVESIIRAASSVRNTRTRLQSNSAPPLVTPRAKRLQKRITTPASAAATGPGGSRRLTKWTRFCVPQVETRGAASPAWKRAEVIRQILPSLNLWERPERSPLPRLFPHQLEAFLATLTPEHAPQI